MILMFSIVTGVLSTTNSLTIVLLSPFANIAVTLMLYLPSFSSSDVTSNLPFANSPWLSTFVKTSLPSLSSTTILALTASLSISPVNVGVLSLSAGSGELVENLPV